jgi:hypothetical protein
MLLDTIFAPFVKERAICVTARTAERQYTRETSDNTRRM